MIINTGDWVVCKRAPNTAHQRFEGEVRQVGAVHHEDRDGRHFLLQPSTALDGLDLLWTKKYLRKLDDPDVDAVDESKAWLPPVPLPTICPSLLPTKESA